MGVCLTESHAAVVLGVAVGLLLGPRLADDEQEVDQS